MDNERKKNIKEFINRWSGYHSEDQEARSFLIELWQDVLGADFPTRRINFEKRVRISKRIKKIDAYIPETKTLIEMKSSDEDLQNLKRKDYKTAYEQAKKYYDGLDLCEQGRYIITCNFNTFEIYDMNHKQEPPLILKLSDLEKEFRVLDILIDPSKSDPEIEKIRVEQEVSVKAGELVGTLYNLFLKQLGPKPEPSQLKDLNILIVRIVFCLYCEDSGLFNWSQFHDFLKCYSPQNTNVGLEELFEVLNTPVENRVPAYLTPELMAFPYVNGGLFAKKIRIPRFTPEITQNILKYMSEQFNWAKISPTIFGAVFESTLNPETRRTGGMHYTSIENIHKVIDPLFLDDLKTELEEIRSLKRTMERKRRADKFQEKLEKLKFLDPACGSGNFLTESYLSLRKLENEAIKLQIPENAPAIGVATIRVHIQQFYGIEINDFAVSVATTALYIAEAQMFQETQAIAVSFQNFLPLSSYSNIIEGNALTMDWNEIIPKEDLAYVMGNPPFLNYNKRSTPEGRKQTAEIEAVYRDPMGKVYRSAKKNDYVAGWFFKAAQYIQGTEIKCAFVATNSITQGEQVETIWKPIYERFNIQIDFAYRSFVWLNEASSQAHVHVVIIGFSAETSNIKKEKKKYIYFSDHIQVTGQINPYLLAGPTVFISSRNKPLQNQPLVTKGSQPTAGDFFYLTTDEKMNVLKKEPTLAPLIRPVIGSAEFIQGKKRYCFWLKDVSPHLIAQSSILKERLKKIAELRSKSTKEATRDAAARPWLFQEIRQPDSNYLVIPETSSENREYIPIGFMPSNVIATNSIQMIPNATLYDFGIITSSVHMAWMRTVAGRLKSDYRYSNKIVYNNFPWPSPTDKQKEKIESTAQAILDARAKYPNSSLADLYDPLLMPIELRKAHEANDRAVKEAYGMPKNITESETVVLLMKLYKQLSECD